MWGDPERAIRLEESDTLATLLFQVTGPAHIGWQDPRWQELLHGYNVWVHVEPKGDASGVLEQACKSLVQHAPRSSNLAALTLHATRMLRELVPSSPQQQKQQPLSSPVADFSNRIAMVGKARATAGCLNLLRVLIHAVIVESSASTTTTTSQQQQQEQDTNYLQEVFLYKSRESSTTHDTAGDLMTACLSFLIVSSSSSDAASPLLTTTSSATTTNTIPELYDTTVLCLELLLVLFSSQLYQPLISSFQRQEQQQQQQCNNNNYFFWDIFMEQARNKQKTANDDNGNNNNNYDWTTTTITPRSLLSAWLDWMLNRPAAPPRSIAHHNIELARSVVQAKGEKMAADGMYESHMIVSACSSSNVASSETITATADASSMAHATTSTTTLAARRPSGSLILDVTKGALILSSSIILLPFRLMSLALGLWGHREKGYDQVHRKQLQTLQHSNLTKDVLWLTDSPVADLACCLLLLVSNNERCSDDDRTNGNNPFREELAALTDNRWDVDNNNADDGGHALPDLPDPSRNTISEYYNEESAPLMALSSPPPPPTTTLSSPATRSKQQNVLAINFEALFEAFGRTAHNEVGALLLYTLMQASQAFADSIAVRSDLDTLVLPLLRTLYIASAPRHYDAQDYYYYSGSSSSSSGRGVHRRTSNESFSSLSSSSPPMALSIRSCPFRSLSQLYVIIILLLLFSQDASFGADAFRRVRIATVSWYKERQVKDISLGSVLLLCLLRSLTFNMNRIHDAFLLSNCCAILMNLSPAISDLHEYAAMRLAAVTISSMKRYIALRKDNPDAVAVDDEDDLSTPTAMHGEVSRTLLRVLKQCLAAKNIENNLHLVYALVYHQTDFKKLIATKGCPYKKGEIERIQKVMEAASAAIERQGDARTAAKALKVLSENMEEIRNAVADRRKRPDSDGYTFTYEEEADPEIFFVPYVWEVIVCAATSSLLEWNKPRIQVFPLLDEPVDEGAIKETDVASNGVHEFTKDISDVV